jgi:hypothetical protein
MQPTVCSTENCERPAFAKGLCNRCYHQQWRRANGTPERKTLEGTTCSVDNCAHSGYHDHPEHGVLCRQHDDRVRRNGSPEYVDRKDRPSCSVEGCSKPVHSREYCQAHYRKDKKYGDPLSQGVVGRPRTGNGHVRLSDAEKAARAAARRQERDARTECVNGHDLTPENVYTDPRGNRICRTCQASWFGRASSATTSVHNRDKTHCRAGHAYAVYGKPKGKNGGGRYCTICHRYNRIKSKYGVTAVQWDEMVLEQEGRCAICPEPLVEPHIDHDHATGETRRLLCSPCNLVLGLMHDSPERLEAAALYLRGRS